MEILFYTNSSAYIASFSVKKNTSEQSLKMKFSKLMEIPGFLYIFEALLSYREWKTLQRWLEKLK